MPATLATVGGRFFRGVVVGREERVLAKPRPVDCGRYHAPGQAALYMSPELDWARWVADWYTGQDGARRVLLPLVVSRARVLDLRDDEACRRLGVDRNAADVPWRATAQAGGTPPSWDVADAARRAGAEGLIDRSRLFPGAWHVTLFAWNEPGRPQVVVTGEALPVT